MSITPKVYVTPYSKRKKRRKIKRIALFVLFVLIFVTISTYLFLSWMIQRESKELERIQIENQRLRTEIKKYQSSDRAYEEFLRVQMGYIEEGEKIILYKDKTNKPQ
ncbi:MAG: FtsB family cell division protein [Caldimicrobium sp.]